MEEDGILVFWRSKLSEELESPYLFWFSNPAVPLKAKWTRSVRFILSAWYIFFYPCAFLLPSPSECFLPSLPCLSLGSSWLVRAQASGQMQSPASYCAHHCRKWSETQELKSRVTVREWGITSWENSGKTEAGQGLSLEEQGCMEPGCMHLEQWDSGALRGLDLKTAFFKITEWPLATSVYSLFLPYFGTMVGCQI